MIGKIFLALIGLSLAFETRRASAAVYDQDPYTGEPLAPPWDSPLTLLDTMEDFMNKHLEEATGAHPQAAWMTGAYWEYAEMIRDAELQYGVPENLLARLLYQESHYRPEIIAGAKKSPAGAIGIAQFMPATAADRGVDPYNPRSSIYGAASYLAWLYAQLGSWQQALAAYNWGIGNVKKWQRGEKTPPLETENYVAQITNDVPVA